MSHEEPTDGLAGYDSGLLTAYFLEVLPVPLEVLLETSKQKSKDPRERPDLPWKRLIIWTQFRKNDEAKDDNTNKKKPHPWKRGRMGPYKRKPVGLYVSSP